MLKKNQNISDMSGASASTCDSVNVYNKYAQYPEELDWEIEYLTPAHVKEVEKCNGFAPG